MKQPIEIRCPKCSSAPTLKCLVNTLWCSKYIYEFHPERIEAAKESK